MRSSPQKDSNTPPGSSSRTKSRTSIHGVLHHRSPKETVQSYQRPLSNSSVHTTTAVIHEGLFGFSEQGPLPPVTSDISNTRPSLIFDDKSLISLEKRSRNQSQSTVRSTESNGSSTATSTQRHEFCSPTPPCLEDSDEAKSYKKSSTLRSSRATAPTLITDPGPSPIYVVPPSDASDSQRLSKMFSKARKPSTVGTPFIQEYPNLPLPPDSHESSKASGSRDRDSSVSYHKSRNVLYKPSPRLRRSFVFTARTTIHEAESDPFSMPPPTSQPKFISSFRPPFNKETTTSSVAPSPRRRPRANTVILNDLVADPVVSKFVDDDFVLTVSTSVCGSPCQSARNFSLL